MKMINRITCMISLLFSSLGLSAQINVKAHSQDNNFRDDYVKAFESKYIKNNTLLNFPQEAGKGSSLLMQYYRVIKPPFLLNDRSIDELSQLAQQDLYVAMLNLGDIYSDASSKYYDIKLAINWYKRAVNSHQSSQALDRLGFIYGVILNDINEAVHYYSSGCELGNASSCYNLSIALNKSNADLAKIKEALLKSYSLGHAKAGMDLYVIYKDSDKEKAHGYLKFSADGGFPNAQYFLGEHYFEADDEILGLTYMSMAAENGLVDAQAYLGKFYSQRIKSEKDFEIAEKWYLKAAIAGNEPALENLIILYKIYESLIPNIQEKRKYLLEFQKKNKMSKTGHP